MRDLVLMSVGLSPAIVTKTPLQQAPIPHHHPPHYCIVAIIIITTITIINVTKELF